MSNHKALFSGKTDTAFPIDFSPIKEPSFTVTESMIDEIPDVCYALIVSETHFDNSVVLDFIEAHSGLKTWYIVPGYPYKNKDNLFEWKVTRRKDW